MCIYPMYKCGGQRSVSIVLHLIFLVVSLSESKAHHVTMLTGQWAAGTHLTPPLQYWNYRCVFSCSAVSGMQGIWIQVFMLTQQTHHLLQHRSSPCTPHFLVGSDKMCIITEVYSSVWPQTPGDQQAKALQPWSSFSCTQSLHKAWKSMSFAIFIF